MHWVLRKKNWKKNRKQNHNYNRSNDKFLSAVQLLLCTFTHRCQEEFQLRSSQTYMRARVLEAEHGVCQHCGLHSHDLFIKVRDAPPSQRKEILENTWLTQLSLKQVEHQSDGGSCFTFFLNPFQFQWKTSDQFKHFPILHHHLCQILFLLTNQIVVHPVYYC